MPKFSDVFSITWKVLLALVLISVLCVVGSLIFFGTIGGIGRAILGTKEVHPVGTPSALQPKFDEADAFRTTMPKSVWDKGMDRAVKKRCFIQGMNKEEVARALGEPTTKTSGALSSSWTYQLPPGKCLKYDGDTCIEREKHEQVVFFTPKGNVWMGVGCQTLEGNFAYIELEDLFKESDAGKQTESSGRIVKQSHGQLIAPKSSLSSPFRDLTPEASATASGGGQVRDNSDIPGGTGQGSAYGAMVAMVMLTPTEAVDFKEYLHHVYIAVRRNWLSVMPDSVRLGDQGVISLQFRIMRNGTVPDGEPVRLAGSGKEPLDRAAVSSIRASNPFEALPPAFSGPYIELRFTYYYNSAIPLNSKLP